MTLFNPSSPNLVYLLTVSCITLGICGNKYQINGGGESEGNSIVVMRLLWK